MGDGCALEKKKRKTKAEVNGQHQARLEKGIISRKLCCMDTTGRQHRSHNKVRRKCVDVEYSIAHEINYNTPDGNIP